MSTFLGPIHTWLYQKILFQEMLTKELLHSISDTGIAEELQNKVNIKFGELPRGNSEDIIDSQNIHGWLQDKIVIVEQRFAYVVTQTQLHHTFNLYDICSIAYEFSNSYVAASQLVDENTSAKDFYLLLDNYLLNGMPCDHVIESLALNDEEAIWSLQRDIHGTFWNSVYGNISDYYHIREALIGGMIKDSNLQMKRTNDFHYEIRRKTCTA